MEAAERLADLDTWREAETIKSNPDAPQLAVRRAALGQGKTVYMAVPRLRDEDCFLRLDPAEIDDIDHATTVGGSSEVGVQVGPEEMEPVDLIVSGSVAVSDSGARIGKGEGYSDLEFAILRAFGLVDDETATVTTVHEMQIVDESIETSPHDVPMERICTPDRTIATEQAEKPARIDWRQIDDERIEEIPILQRLET
jgi:5-formyltetrahydrofolate cyclo-ligase